MPEPLTELGNHSSERLLDLRTGVDIEAMIGADDRDRDPELAGAAFWMLQRIDSFI